jgi:ABC-type lipoprotein export system ATPase subunit
MDSSLAEVTVASAPSTPASMYTAKAFSTREFGRDAFLGQAEAARATIATSKPIAQGVDAGGLEADLRDWSKSLRDRAGQLRAQNPQMRPRDLAELRELEARLELRANRAGVLAKIDRRKRLAAYAQCIEDTSTGQITRKSTELTKQLVTDQLRKAFQNELTLVGFTHRSIEIKAAGGSKGTLFHQLVFSNAPGVSVAKVLSEGESRTLSLAAFLAELSTAAAASAIIFDDPVSSLDHFWRERIARRLAQEAKGRQVIVFTHDILFLRRLWDEAQKHTVAVLHQYVRRETEPGICSSDLPWFAMRVKERIGVLRKRVQALGVTHRSGTVVAYEAELRELFGLLREAWEQAVGEVLLNGVVERYRDSIETKRLVSVHDITEADCKTVDDAMTESSRWIRGHDQAGADGRSLPQPSEVADRVSQLHLWMQGIVKRRE